MIDFGAFKNDMIASEQRDWLLCLFANGLVVDIYELLTLRSAA